jgi:hypothetical protein
MYNGIKIVELMGVIPQRTWARERDRQKVAYNRTYYDAQYSLDCGDGIDNEALFVCTIP